MKKYVAALTVMLMCGITQARTQELYRCVVLDAVVIENGKFVQNNVSEYWKNSIDPIIVDTASGVLRVGTLNPRAWVIVQHKTASSDFVVTLHETKGRANDTLRLRGFVTPTVFTYTLNGFLILSGTCEVLR